LVERQETVIPCTLCDDLNWNKFDAVVPVVAPVPVVPVVGFLVVPVVGFFVVPVVGFLVVPVVGFFVVPVVGFFVVPVVFAVVVVEDPVVVVVVVALQEFQSQLGHSPLYGPVEFPGTHFPVVHHPQSGARIH